MHYRGRQYHKGRCYLYKDGGTTCEVGIRDFISAEKVKCSLIVQFKETFLGKTNEGVDLKEFRPSTRLQVVQGVPLLSQIPVLGPLFSYLDDQRTKTELVVFIKPVVIKEASVDKDLKGFQQNLPTPTEPGVQWPLPRKKTAVNLE